ncbi:MAG: acyl--CoA ligase [Proteobacteria bacterium]|nr:acyl--CoA ligase [Pseudomonadota bacterium]
MERRGEIESQLLGAGSPFELAREKVLGEEMEVFRRRLPSLRAALEASAAHGDAEYWVQDEVRLTYAEHASRVASVARALQEQFGVGPGDRVAILAANCPEWILTFWATVSLGGTAVALNGWWAGDEIRYGVSDSDPRVLVGDRKRLERIAGWDPGRPVVEIESEFESLANSAPDAALPTHPIDEDDPASILYTSGTTGRPKGAVHTHRNVIALAGLQFFHGARLAMANVSGGAAAPRTQPVILVSTPLFHVSGLYTGAVTTLAAGSKTVWLSGRFDPVRVMETIEREQVTNWSPMGTMAHRVVHHPDVGRYDLSSVRGSGSGGAPVAPELQQRLREVFPNAAQSLGLGYGQTECTALATLAFGDELEKRPGAVGRALPTVQVEVRDAEGRPVPDGVEGEIYVRSPLVMAGYWRNPEATEEVLRPGRWLNTGDWGRLDDGVLTLNSRRRDLILRGAENVYPTEIELRLEAHPEVAEAAVVGVDDEEWGQEVKAIVVPVGDCTPEPAALAAFVAETLAAFKVPNHWEIRREPLPRNATGKVMKGVLTGDADNPFVDE